MRRMAEWIWGANGGDVTGKEIDSRIGQWSGLRKISGLIWERILRYTVESISGSESGEGDGRSTLTSDGPWTLRNAISSASLLWSYVGVRNIKLRKAGNWKMVAVDKLLGWVEIIRSSRRGRIGARVHPGRDQGSAPTKCLISRTRNDLNDPRNSGVERGVYLSGGPSFRSFQYSADNEGPYILDRPSKNWMGNWYIQVPLRILIFGQR